MISHLEPVNGWFCVKEKGIEKILIAADTKQILFVV